MTPLPTTAMAALLRDLQLCASTTSVVDALAGALRESSGVADVRTTLLPSALDRGLDPDVVDLGRQLREEPGRVFADGATVAFALHTATGPVAVIEVTAREEVLDEDLAAFEVLAAAAALACARAQEADRRRTLAAEAGAMNQLMEGVAAATSAAHVARAGLDVLSHALRWDGGAVLRSREDDADAAAALPRSADDAVVLAHRNAGDLTLDDLAAIAATGHGLHGALVGEELPGGVPHAVVWPLHQATDTRLVLVGWAPAGIDAGLGAVLSPIAQLASVVRAGLERIDHAARERRAEELEHANRAKSEFLSRMSHELRTPLNSVLGFAQLLELEPLEVEARDSVAHIRKAGEHLLKLVDEVLDIARIEAGRMALSLEPLQLHEVLQECCALVQTVADAHGTAITLEDLQVDGADIDVPHPDVRTGDTWVLADRQRVVQVLLNLLTNAVKYNRPGGRVAVRHRAGADGMVCVDVSDTGSGIAPELMARLFVPFDRLGAEASSVEGVGLGLAVSHRLTHVMGGALTARSVPGEGSTFTLELPRTAPVQDPVVGAADDAALDVRPSGGTVLYVEDNWPNVKLLERVLGRRPGIRLLHAPDGPSGLAAARRQLPDLVLLDLDLPGMSGQEVLRHLKADPETCHVPVVVVSADTNATTIRDVRALGARDHIAKPIDIVLLLGTVDEVLDTATDPVGQVVR